MPELQTGFDLYGVDLAFFLFASVLIGRTHCTCGSRVWAPTNKNSIFTFFWLKKTSFTTHLQIFEAKKAKWLLRWAFTTSFSTNCCSHTGVGALKIEKALRKGLKEWLPKKRTSKLLSASKTWGGKFESKSRRWRSLQGHNSHTEQVLEW